LFPFLTVAENILLPFKVKGKAVTGEVEQRYRRWMEVCELNDYAGYYPFQLSGGMRQKVSLIRGLLPEPHFIMLDEPFQSINAAAKQGIIAAILTTLPDISILFVTHIAEEIPALAQTVLYFQTPCLTRPERMPADQLKNKLSVPHFLFASDEN
jgi:ABC-type nitrate/sulfonate/bicarbonate transport system ATPase subunit